MRKAVAALIIAASIGIAASNALAWPHGGGCGGTGHGSMSAAPAVSQESYQKFLASTQELRTEYTATAIEYETLAAQAAPDGKRLDELAARLDGLQGKIHAEAVKNGIPEHVCGYAPAAV